MLSEADRGVLDALKEHGDALVQPREIVHWAYFATSELRGRYVEECLQIGFKLDGTSEPHERSAEFGARISHIDVPTEDVIERITALLRALASQCSGEYDGWETQVV